jgi:hypothetical protein
VMSLVMQYKFVINDLKKYLLFHISNHIPDVGKGRLKNINTRHLGDFTGTYYVSSIFSKKRTLISKQL